MTRSELHDLVDRIPERGLDGRTEWTVTADDLDVMTKVVIELARRLGAVATEWIRRERDRLGFWPGPPPLDEL